MGDSCLVSDIRVADTPVDCRRGVISIDQQQRTARWSVFLYDPRPGALRSARGLELPFRAYTEGETLLLGWVKVGPRNAGVILLEGVGPLRHRRAWHRLPAHERYAGRGGPQGPSSHRP